MKNHVIEVLASKTFTIPSIPPSVNAIYDINFAQRRVYMKKEVAMWKTDSKVYIPAFKASDGLEYFRVSMTFYYNFFFKNGKVRKFDTQNLMKVLIDAISEKIGFNDSVVKFGEWESYHSETEFVEVLIEQVKLKCEEKPDVVPF